MKTKNQSVEKREKPLKNKIRLHSDRAQIADNESLPEAEKSGSETTGKPVEVCVGSFSSPENYAGVPDGGEVIFCGDEYCPKKFRDVEFSHYRMHEIATREGAQAVGSGFLAVIAAGGKKATENGKIAALGTGLPLVVFAFDPGYIGYGDRVFETTERDGSVTVRAAEGKIKIVFDPSVSCDPDRVAAGYGAICTSLVYLFEKEVRSVLSREKYDRKVAAEVLKVVAAAIKAETVSSPSEAVIRGIAALTGIFAGERFMGGESVARVAELLKKRKSREENAAFLCRETLCVYRLVMRLITPAVRVPDVNARLDFMAKRFGISPVVLTKNLGRYVPAGELARKIYCVREFAPDLDVKAAAYLGILDFAFKRFKRLYKDRGFSYNGYVRAEEKKLCFALAPDVGSAFTLLDLARETGLTDALIQRKTDERIAQKN